MILKTAKVVFIVILNCKIFITGVYCLQYDDDKIISGLRDNTIKMWQRSDLTCTETLTGDFVFYFFFI